MSETAWVLVGFLGQSAFFSRWLAQWIYSERQKKSGIPVIFWYLSIVGGVITLIYAIHRKDPVFITGQMIASFIYVRNLMLFYKQPSTS